MTYPSECTLPTKFLKQLTSQGLESLPELDPSLGERSHADGETELSGGQAI